MICIRKPVLLFAAFCCMVGITATAATTAARWTLEVTGSNVLI